MDDNSTIRSFASGFENYPHNIAIASNVMHSIVVILHSCGLYLLFKVKKTQNDNMVVYCNKKLLIFLSCSELFCGLLFLTSYVILQMKEWLLHSTFTVIMLASAGLSLSATYLITLNRLVSTMCPLWYRCSMTETKFIVVAVSVCVVVTGIQVVCSLVVYGYLTGQLIIVSRPTFLICKQIISAIYNLYLIFCVFTYVLIFITILRSRRNSHTNNNDGNSTTTCQFILNFIKTQGYTVPLLITSTFFGLVTIPLSIQTQCKIDGWSPHSLVCQIWRLTYPLNNISDALVYVLFDRDIRNHLKMKFTRRNRPQADTAV